MNPRYYPEDQASLKTLGNELKGLLIKRSPDEHFSEIEFAYVIAQEVLGFLPMDDGPNKMTNQAIKVGIGGT